jgi:hypothetical protein
VVGVVLKMSSLIVAHNDRLAQLVVAAANGCVGQQPQLILLTVGQGHPQKVVRQRQDTSSHQAK